jgi:hypothetical protein
MSNGGGGTPATATPEHSLERWLAHLESLHPRGQAGIELGLERVQRVKRELGQHPQCPLVTVGGTNGKGSTCAYLEAIYHFVRDGNEVIVTALPLYHIFALTANYLTFLQLADTARWAASTASRGRASWSPG